MPAIKKVSYTQTFSKLNEISFDAREYNDCAVKAVALVCGVEYKKALDKMTELGRKARRGTDFFIIDQAIKFFGKRTARIDKREIIANYPSPHRDVLKSITTHHPRRFNKVWPKGTYLLYSKGHVSACIDGVVHDWAINRAKRVWRMEQVS